MSSLQNFAFLISHSPPPATLGASREDLYKIESSSTMTGGRDCPPLGRGRLRLAAGNPSEPVELWCQRKASPWARLSCSHPVPLWGERETHTLASVNKFWLDYYFTPLFQDNTTTTLYLWSRGGRAVTLPPDTGFPVGGASKVQYLVLQVSFALFLL